MIKVCIAFILLLSFNNIFSRSYNEFFESNHFGPIVSIKEKSTYKTKFENEEEVKIYSFENNNHYTVQNLKSNIAKSFPIINKYSKYIDNKLIEDQIITNLTSDGTKNEIIITSTDDKRIIEDINYYLHQNEWKINNHYVSEFHKDGRIITSYFIENEEKIHQRLYYYDSIDRNFPTNNIIVKEYYEEGKKYLNFAIRVWQITVKDEQGLNIKVRQMSEYSSGFPETYVYETTNEIYSNIVVHEYIFNSYGNVGKHIRSNYSETKFKEYLYSYEYDKNNNWVKKKIKNNNDILVESIRDITYK